MPNGYFRNYLKPQNLAALATAGILEYVHIQIQFPLFVYPSCHVCSASTAYLTTDRMLGLGCFRNIEREQRRIEQQAREVKAKAQAMAIALSTIGKFVIKKKIGEGDKIFGRSATALARPPFFICQIWYSIEVQRLGIVRQRLMQSLCCCSVTTAEVCDAIFKQTGQELNKKDVELPEITTLGSYPSSIRLHPEVVGQFTVVVQREKNVG